MASFSDLFKNTSSWIQNKAKEAASWYRNAIMGMRNRNGNNGEGISTVGHPQPGRMYLYYYDPLHKQKLPYWDQYPLIIFLRDHSLKNGAGFSAVNLHYLPPLARAAYLQQLIAESEDNTRIDLSRFDIRKTPGFEQCIHMYLYNHVRSSFHEIHHSQWERIVLLPLQRWIHNTNPRKARRAPY